MDESRSLDDHDFLFKVVLLGSSGVGKSNLLLRFTGGVEFATSNLAIDNHHIKTQIWDTAGQERYRAITSAYYRGAVGALVVYDVTSRASFEAIDRWLGELKSQASAAQGDLVTILLGNKIDLEAQRQVNTVEGQEAARRQGLLFMETSALSGEHVAAAFQELVRECYYKAKQRRMASGGSSDDDGPGVSAGRTITVGAAEVSVEQPQQAKCCS